MIGAAGLSEQAKALEDAAKIEDGAFIRAHHEAAMAEHKRLIEGIAGAYEEPEKTEGSENAEDGNDDVLEFLPGEE